MTVHSHHWYVPLEP